MDFSRIVNDYLNHMPARALSRKYGLDLKKVKAILRNSMSKEQYMRIAHEIGAFHVREKLEDARFRKQYARKMKRSVADALRRKMADPVFRRRWIKKARSASVEGNNEINRLLRDPDFIESWQAKCKKGGRVLLRSKKGIFNPMFASERRAWSIRGLERTGRKVFGPKGERMYNYLEVRVANIVLRTGMKYEYGKAVPVDSGNGFIMPDFFISDPPLILEVTYWDDVRQKCRELDEKSHLLSERFPMHPLLVITKQSKRDHYKSMLPDSIPVLTPNQLEHFLAGLRISKRSGVTDSIS